MSFCDHVYNMDWCPLMTQLDCLLILQMERIDDIDRPKAQAH